MAGSSARFIEGQHAGGLLLGATDRRNDGSVCGVLSRRATPGADRGSASNAAQSSASGRRRFFRDWLQRQEHGASGEVRPGHYILDAVQDD